MGKSGAASCLVYQKRLRVPSKTLHHLLVRDRSNGRQSARPQFPQFAFAREQRLGQTDRQSFDLLRPVKAAGIGHFSFQLIAIGDDSGDFVDEIMCQHARRSATHVLYPSSPPRNL